MLEIKNLQEKLQLGLSSHLSSLLPAHVISNAYKYAVLPPGKLFRPLISMAIYKHHTKETLDAILNLNASRYASFLELHHSYTLVHDDMPCMDNDDMRRGKLSTHKKFGQWQALLVGDGLQAASWQLLAKIDHENLSLIFKYSSWCVGAKGLLQGQVLDLSNEMTASFDNLVLTHKLKTARLIQASLVGGYLLTDSPNFKQACHYHRLGESLGISFQFLDDLTELTEELGEHEKEVNPWLWAKEESKKELIKQLEKVQLLTPIEASLLNNILGNYFAGIFKKVQSNKDNILKYLDDDFLRPVEALLKALSLFK